MRHEYLPFRVRRSIRKKAREKTVTKIKSSSWSHNPSARKDVQIKLKSKKASASHGAVPRSQSHKDPGPDLTKDVYKEILDIVNVNSPNSLPFGKARMAHWVLSSKPYYSEEV